MAEDCIRIEGFRYLDDFHGNTIKDQLESGPLFDQVYEDEAYAKLGDTFQTEHDAGGHGSFHSTPGTEDFESFDMVEGFDFFI